MAWLFGLTFGYMQDDQTMKVCSCLVPLTTDMRSRKKQAVPAPRGGLPSPTACSLYGWVLLLPFLPLLACNIRTDLPYTDIGFSLVWGCFKLCIELPWIFTNMT